ncbi:MAG: FAD-binding oxidoreductase [Verrucomicrobia bacterium]|nr:FAD-binding oxidoreductase [Verrucomicrobiota bacterium]
MGITNRRQFIQQGVLAAATLCTSRIKAVADLSQPGKTQEQALASLDPAAIRRLGTQISGPIITPESAEYESARMVFNRAFDRRPALIVRCSDASDVARTLEFVQKQNLPLAVRGGGHNRAGFGVCDGGAVMDLSRMNRVDVDAQKRVARAEAGALVRDLDQATQRFGLATTSGGCPTVGIAGLTLGGGEGFLMSKYGTACDNLLSAQLVTVDGRLVEASQTSNPDLFWAIRGGGGNFGVATALEYQLHPVTSVLAGTLMYPSGQIPGLLHGFADLVAAAPDELNIVGEVLPSEKGAGFLALFFFCGDLSQGRDLLSNWRVLKPQEDTVREMSYLEAQLTINPYASVAHFQTDVVVPELSATIIQLIATAANDAPPNSRVFMVPIYGAVTRVGVSDTAYALRQPGYELDIMGRWNTQAEKESAVQWVKALHSELQPFARGLYVNQLGETSEELVRAGYGPNYDRLAEIKKKYDPDNVLRLNQNIKPA